MKTISAAIRRAARERLLRPVVGRVVDRGLRWLRGQDGWEGVVSAAIHVALETTPAFGLRTALAEVVRDYGTHLSPASVEVLGLVDEIARKHSPEAN